MQPKRSMRALTVGFLIMTAVMAAAPVARGTLSPGPEAEAWHNSGLDRTFVARFISNQICHRSKRLLQSCLQAISEAPAQIVTKTVGAQALSETGDAQMVRSSQIDFDGVLDRIAELPENREGIFARMLNRQLQFFDPHAVLLPAGELTRILGPQGSRDTGVGFDEALTSAGLFVRKVYEGTPAAQGGLKVNDEIVAIDGESLKKGDKAIPQLAVLSGPVGRPIRLRVRRDGRLREIDTRVGKLDIPNVSLKLNQFGTDQFAVLKIRRFIAGTCEAARQALSSAQAHYRIDGLILDLRTNPGGAVQEAKCVAGLFDRHIPFAKIVPMKDKPLGEFPFLMDSLAQDNALTTAPAKKNKIESLESGPRAPLLDKADLVVLTDSNTRSAAEILAASLQDAQRAWIVGERSFGKGTVQTFEFFPAWPRLALVYTYARSFRPSGPPLLFAGVTPDLDVPFMKGAGMAGREFPRERELSGTGSGAYAEAVAESLAEERAKPWNEPRPRERKRLKDCVEKHRVDEWFSDWQLRRSGHADNQISYALAALHCQRTR
jgi:carboxyl-terminal processing protease